jgi:hypothetical protein
VVEKSVDQDWTAGLVMIQIIKDLNTEVAEIGDPGRIEERRS